VIFRKQTNKQVQFRLLIGTPKSLGQEVDQKLTRFDLIELILHSVGLSGEN
jgi:hypothetical protein